MNTVTGRNLHKQWKLKRLRDDLRARLDHVDYGSPKLEERQLADYLSESGEWVDAHRMGWVPSIDVGLLGLLYQRQGAYAMLCGDEGGREKLALGTLYRLRAVQFNLVRQDRIFAQTRRAHFGFEAACRDLAETISLGWIVQASGFGRWLIRGTLNGYYFDAAADHRNCVNWFYLKLFVDMNRIVDVVWPDHTTTASEYEMLLEIWRTADTAALMDALLAACDRHTHECFSRSGDESKRKDFASDLLYGWPIEIHMVLRLREALGLPNPELEHPLMQTGLAALQPGAPMQADALLEAVTEKVCRTYPELRAHL